MEFCSGGNLRKLMEQMKDWSFEDKMKRTLRVMFHVLSGLKHIHSLKIIHHDLSPENILVDRFEITKICDFGQAARSMSKSYFRTPATKNYNPPEAYDQNQFCYESDIW
ncbi:MAG: hypothetical protein EZS28_054464, partial [Streblomastix strix]